MVVEKRKIEVNGIAIEYTIVDDMPDFDNDPCFQRQLKEAKAFLDKHPFPGVTLYNNPEKDKE